MGARSRPGDDRAARAGVGEGDRRVSRSGAGRFARVVSDGSSMAWLGDVFVLEGHRGHGLGVELVREAVEHPAHRDLAWFLNTRDAHSLYERFGFEQPNERTMVRLRRS